MSDRINIVGCGYIGQLLALQLMKKQYRPVAFANTQSSLENCQHQCISVNLLHLDENPQALALKNEKLIYLVPPQSKGEKDVRMQSFIKAVDKNTPCKIVLISTTGVYGDCAGEWVDENRKISPFVARAKRRADAEQQLVKYCESHDIPWVILRVPGIYGPGKFPLKRIESSEPIVCQQDSPYSNRIHAYDLVEICMYALLSNTITGIYNCSDGHPTTMYDYFIKVSDKFGLKHPPEISLQQAQNELSTGMMSYISESRRVSNKKLLTDFKIRLKYPDLDAGLESLK